MAIPFSRPAQLQPGVRPDEETDLYGNPLLPSPGSIGDLMGAAIKRIGGGGLGNFSPAPSPIEAGAAAARRPAAPAMRSPIEDGADVAFRDVRGGGSSTADTPGIGQDESGALVARGRMAPPLRTEDVPSSVRGGAFQFSGQGDFGQNTPDVSLAAMLRNRRTRRLLDDRYAEPQERQFATRRAEAGTQLAEAQAADPYDLRKTGGVRAIEAAVALDKERQQQAQVASMIRQADAAIDAEAQQHLAGLMGMPAPEQAKAIQDLKEQVAAAKQKARQDIAISTGRASINFRPDAGTLPGMP